MLQLQPNSSSFQTITCTINERLKDWDLKTSTLGVLFVFTNQLTQKDYKVIFPNENIVKTGRYWGMSKMRTSGDSPVTEGGVLLSIGGYYNYLCYAINEMNIDIDLTNPDKSHFVERGLLLIGEAQDYFTEYAEPLTNSIAYNGQ